MWVCELRAQDSKETGILCEGATFLEQFETDPILKQILDVCSLLSDIDGTDIDVSLRLSSLPSETAYLLFNFSWSMHVPYEPCR